MLQYVQNTTWKDLPTIQDTVLTVNYLLLYKDLCTIHYFQYTVHSNFFQKNLFNREFKILTQMHRN